MKLAVTRIMGLSACIEPGLRTAVQTCAFVLASLSGAMLSALVAAEPLAQLEEQAMKAAVARVAPSVVRIEAVGGLEQVGGVLIADHPHSGIGYDAFDFGSRQRLKFKGGERGKPLSGTRAELDLYFGRKKSDHQQGELDSIRAARLFDKRRSPLLRGPTLANLRES